METLLLDANRQEVENAFSGTASLEDVIQWGSEAPDSSEVNLITSIMTPRGGCPHTYWTILLEKGITEPVRIFQNAFGETGFEETDLRDQFWLSSEKHSFETPLSA